MSIPAPYSYHHCYHFTHLENLETIVEHGLLSTNTKKRLNITHKDVALSSIQARRKLMEVTCVPDSTIHDYVPFYICVRNPMLLKLVLSKNVDQIFLIFFVMKLDKVSEDNVVFSDASANTVIPPNFYNNPADLDKLDWKAIDSQKWASGGSEAMHHRMAEVLVYDSVPFDMIECIVVWNEHIKEEVEKAFKAKGIESPPIRYSPIGNSIKYNFFYTKFHIGRDNHSLITGPISLKNAYKGVKKHIEKERLTLKENGEFVFENIKDALKQLESKFTLIAELEGIFELETDNAVHKENVSDHTLTVISNLERQPYYIGLNEDDQNILKLAAYLHDTGKGPKGMWKGGIQQSYPDHPADSLMMLKRVLVEDFRIISPYEIRYLCLLVAYHDLIGEIFGNDRDRKQLFAIIESEKDFDMLAILNFSDVLAINKEWAINFKAGLRNLKRETLKEIEEK